MIEQLHLIRHGETAWSLSGRHTGRTDVPLTDRGEQNARRWAEPLRAVTFTHVFTSPRLRARRTCELAGLGAVAEIEPDLAEWDYGEYEGLRSEEILRSRPGWNIFRDGCPGGESAAMVSARADRLLVRLRALDGKIVGFSHGHFGRVLAVRWIGLPVTEGQHLLLDPASLGLLASDHANAATPVIMRWNLSPPEG
jgi:broad specificity phosphatase PhoE